jgi:8-oxo-dGTP diphosphatase
MINVTCAIIRNEENEVLVVQRGEKTDHPFRWEFPGGKLKENETEEECIIREIREELSMDIVICRRMADTEYDYGIKRIKLIPFVCDTLDELPFLSEHIAFKWLEPPDIKKVDLLEADIIVADNYLMDNVTGADHYHFVSDPGQKAYNEEDLRSMVGNMMGRKEAEWLAESAVENGEILKKLLEYSFSKDKKLAFRASWTLSKVYDKYPDLIGSDLQLMIGSLESLDNESVQRSFLRMISMSDLNSINLKQQGIMATIALKCLSRAFRL